MTAEKSSSERDIFEAAARNDLVRVRHLCESSAMKAVTSLDPKSHSPLHWAALNNAARVAQYLLDKGADVQAKEADFGQTPLHWAVLRGHINMVRLLIRNGSPLEDRDSAGCTPIHYAGQYGQTLVGQILLADGSQSQPLDNKGRTPLMWACHLGHHCCARFFIDVGNSVNLQDNDEKRTAAHWAARSGHTSVIKVLQRHGADFSLTDQDGRNVAGIALKEGKEELAELVDSYKSLATRVGYKWKYRMRQENAEPITVANMLIVGHAVFYYNVLGYTTYHHLILLQLMALAVGTYCYSRLRGSKEAGCVIRNDFENLQGGWSAAHNDNLFTGLRICKVAKVAMPLRSFYSEPSGNLVRRYHAYCAMAGVDICSENMRVFVTMLACMMVDLAIAAFVSCQLISVASMDAPSIMLPHLFVWYGLWQPGYAILTMLAMYSCFMCFVAGTRLQTQVGSVLNGISAHEEAVWMQYTYLQDPAGRLKNPFNNGMKTNVMNFLQGKKVPENDLHSIMELKPKPWRHPKDKRTSDP